MSIDKVQRYYNTVKYLKLSQTVGRIYSLGKTRLFRNTNEPVLMETDCRLNSSVAFIFHDPWNCREGIINGTFKFLNVEKHFSNNKIDWMSKDMPLLWRFNLHYFGYLFLLDYNEKLDICRNWITNNLVGKTVGWHPYPLSLRIVNWCKAGIDDSRVCSSLFIQAAYLSRHLETYHPGNHLLENARALIFAGVYFSGHKLADKWLEKGLKILKKELNVQILKDGGYFERSIMYHALMLECILDIINVLPENLNDSKQEFIEIAKRMGIFLLSLTHPDGKIALFNDSTFEIALSVNELLTYLNKLTGFTAVAKHSFNDAGFYIYKDDNLYLAIDGGPIGPDYIPAHAHADIFSYELSLFSNRIIVDSGVFEYPAGEMRSYVRSTKAHNTVTIDDLDQAECWDSFRVARRYPPSEVVFENSENSCRFQGSFNGYASLIGDNLVHRRKISHDGKNRTVTVEDYISGNGRHKVKSFIHFIPGIKIQHADNTVLLNFNNRKIRLLINGGQYSFQNGWYCPRFGEKYPNSILVIEGDKLPLHFSYQIYY